MLPGASPDPFAGRESSELDSSSGLIAPASACENFHDLGSNKFPLPKIHLPWRILFTRRTIPRPEGRQLGANKKHTFRRTKYPSHPLAVTASLQKSRSSGEPSNPARSSSAAANYQHVLNHLIDGLIRNLAIRRWGRFEQYSRPRINASYPTLISPALPTALSAWMVIHAARNTGVYYDTPTTGSLTSPRLASDPKARRSNDEFIDKNSNLITGAAIMAGIDRSGQVADRFLVGHARLIYPTLSNVNTVLKSARAGLYTAYSDNTRHTIWFPALPARAHDLRSGDRPKAHRQRQLVRCFDRPAGTKLTKISKSLPHEAYDDLKIQRFSTRSMEKNSLGTKSAPA